VRARQTCGRAERPADCKSAIWQSATLRYLGCGFDARSRVAGFRTRKPFVLARAADLEVGDTAGLETCATVVVPRCAPARSRIES
jgi:hypothetical protein